VVLMVIITLKTSSSKGISPSCFDNGYRNGRFFQLHIPHFSSIQRTGGGTGRLLFQ